MKRRAGSKSLRSGGLIACCLLALTGVYVLHTRSAAPGPNSFAVREQAQADADLIEAVKENRLDEVKRLLDSGASPNARGEGDSTALRVALCQPQPNLDIITALLDAGADLEAGNGIGERPLVYAVKYGDLSVLRLLLNRGANVNAQRMGGETALHAAVEKGDVEVINTLVLYGADVNLPDRYGITPLYNAAFKEDHPEVGTALINQGADVNAKSAFGVTPLMVAATANNPVLARALIEHGADVNAVNKKHESALDSAVASGSHEIVSLLRKAKRKQ